MNRAGSIYKDVISNMKYKGTKIADDRHVDAKRNEQRDAIFQFKNRY